MFFLLEKSLQNHVKETHCSTIIYMACFMKTYFSTLISILFISTSSYSSDLENASTSVKELLTVKMVTEESEKIIRSNDFNLQHGLNQSFTRDLNHFLNQNIHKYLEHHDVLGHNLTYTLSKIIFEVVIWDLIVEEILNATPNSEDLIYHHINERTGSPVLLNKFLAFIAFKINNHYGPVVKSKIFNKIDKEVKPKLHEFLKQHMFHSLENNLYRNLKLLNFYDKSHENFQKSGIDYLFASYMVMSLPVRKHEEYNDLLVSFAKDMSEMISESKVEDIILSIDLSKIRAESVLVESSLKIIKNNLPSDYETAFLNNSPKQKYF